MDLSTFDATAFARMVRDNDDRTIRMFVESDARPVLLGEIFRRMEEQFRPMRLPLPRLVYHWKILDRPGGGYDHYEVGIKRDRIRINHPPRWDRPTVTFRADGVDFLKLVTGNADPIALVREGRLRLSGNLVFAPLFDRLFERPRASAG